MRRWCCLLLVPSQDACLSTANTASCTADLVLAQLCCTSASVDSPATAPKLMSLGFRALHALLLLLLRFTCRPTRR